MDLIESEEEESDGSFLNGLPSRQKPILTLYYRDNLTSEETPVILGYCPSTAQVLLYLGRKN